MNLWRARNWEEFNMQPIQFNHRDCRNYAPVDVVKGICHISNRMVAADEAVCSCFEKMRKCRDCSQYTPDLKIAEIGVCLLLASGRRESFMAYADLSAVTCTSFTERKE